MIESPFDLFEIETEQAPRGKVSLEGLRGTEKRVWAAGPSNWGIEARPNFPPTLLPMYRSADQLLKANKLDEAVRRWQRLAAQPLESEFRWLSSWLLLHAANLEAEDHHWDEADRLFQEATQAAASSPAALAQIFRSWGAASEKRSDWTSAENRYQQAITETRKFSDGSLKIAAILNNLGVVAEKHGDLKKSEDYHRQALAIQERIAPGSLAAAESVYRLGVAARDGGDLAHAKQYYAQSLAIQEKLAPDSKDVAGSLNGLGVIAWNEGDLATADDYFRRSLTIVERLLPDSLTVANMLNNLGILLGDRGDLVEAMRHHRRALAIREKLAPGSLDVAASLTNLGRVAGQQGDWPRNKRYYSQALEIYRKLAPDSTDLAMALNNLGTVAEETENPAEAEAFYREGLKVWEKLAPNSLYVAASMHNLGNVALKRDDLARAEGLYHQALTIEQQQAPGGTEAAETLMRLGDVARQSARLSEAQQYYKEALAIREKIAPGSSDHAETLAALALLAKQQQQLDAASPLFDRALNALESQTAHLGGAEAVRAEFRAKRASYYSNYIDLLMNQRKPELAFQIMERWRARTLLEMLAEGHIEIRKGVAPSLLERERSLQETLNGKSNQRIEIASGSHTEQQLADIDKQIDEILGRYRELEGQIRADSPSYAALILPQPLSLEEVQHQVLDPDSILLEYHLSEERSYLWLVTRTSIRAFELPKRRVIETAAGSFYHALSENRGASAAGSDLSNILLGPVANQLGEKRLLIVSTGVLQYIPFSALPEPGKNSQKHGPPLMVKHEIVMLPSASTLAALRREAAARQPAPKLLAIMADPVYEKDDPRVKRSRSEGLRLKGGLVATASARRTQQTAVRDCELGFHRLPFSRREGTAIAALAPRRERLETYDFAAAVKTAEDPELSRYRYIHIASHGCVDKDHPELSGVVLSLVDSQGQPLDGFLRLHQIYNLKLNAELVVLSACETGVGKDIQGEGLMGLTRGLMYAGASRVVVSLWSVNDMGTAELMKLFYHGILVDHLTPAAALRAAQIAMWKQAHWQSPYYWAPFVIQGEPK